MEVNNQTFLQRLKDEVKKLTYVQVSSYTIQLFFLSFCLVTIYQYQTGMDFEAKLGRNTIDHLALIGLGLVAFLWAKGIGDEDKKTKE